MSTEASPDRHDRSRPGVEALSMTLTGPQALGGGSALVRRVGAVCWAVVGVLIVVAVLLGALALISEVVLPLLFGVVLAVLFLPLCRRLQEHGWRPALASLVIVVGLVLAVGGCALLAASAVVGQRGAWSAHLDEALADASSTTDAVDLGEDALDELRSAVQSVAGLIAQGLLTLVVSGIGTVLGFLAGSILAALILYYLLKDAGTARARLVGAFPAPARAEVDALVTRSAATVRAYGAARTILSAAVAVLITAWSAVLGLPMLATIAVVNFFGGYVPYIGAVVGGFVVVALALTETGVAGAIATLVVVLLANLALENLVEPRVLGDRLDIHPLVVLVVTTAGGIVGGIVGLILAVPLYVVTVDALSTFRRYALGSGPD
jgi:predicted PurR-regulated permease PerM